MYKSKITGMGMYVPENEITNRDLYIVQFL